MKYRDIAKHLGISTSTAFNRLNALFMKRIIQGVVPILPDKTTGLILEAIIAIRVSHGGLLEIEKKIGQLPAVKAVYDVTGDWDCFLIAKFHTKEEMDSFVKHLRDIPQVVSTNTSFVLNQVKEDFTFSGFS